MMTNYHLSNDQYILPYPHSSRLAAERHAANLGGGYQVVECEPLAVNEDDYEAAEEDKVIEDEIERENNKYGDANYER